MIGHFAVSTIFLPQLSYLVYPIPFIQYHRNAFKIIDICINKYRLEIKTEIHKSSQEKKENQLTMSLIF